jgi:tRNA A37 threonylcarbamoyladenosine dehydratase
MEINQFFRTQLLLGKENMELLKNKRVAIFGVGGVGGYVVEALARSGIGKFVLIDNDDVDVTNINRQIIATLDTCSLNKVDVMKDRILSINKDAEIETRKCFFLPSNQDEFDFSSYDYVVDAVDTVTAKIAIIQKCKENNVPIICALGAGNKINPTLLRVSDISKTKVDPLAKVMRNQLKKRQITNVKCVYSLEKPLKPLEDISYHNDEVKGRKDVPGSTIFVPSVMGLIIASEIVKDITGIKNDTPGA